MCGILPRVGGKLDSGRTTGLRLMEPTTQRPSQKGKERRVSGPLYLARLALQRDMCREEIDCVRRVSTAIITRRLSALLAIRSLCRSSKAFVTFSNSSMPGLLFARDSLCTTLVWYCKTRSSVSTSWRTLSRLSRL